MSLFDSNIACMCQSIEINNNKHVYRQSQVRMPNGYGVEWAECSLIIGAGCRVQVFSLILDSSVGLSAGIHLLAIRCLIPWWVRILHSAEEDNLSPFDSNIDCLCQSIEINNNSIHVCMYVLLLKKSNFFNNYSNHPRMCVLITLTHTVHLIYIYTCIHTHIHIHIHT